MKGYVLGDVLDRLTRAHISSTDLDEKDLEGPDSLGSATADQQRAKSSDSADAVGTAALVAWMMPVICVALAFNVIKGFPTRLQGLMWANWELSYKYGLMRRALGGELFQAFAIGLDRGTQQNVVIVLHTLACTALFAGMIVWILAASRHSTPRTRLLALTGLAAILTAHFVPTTVLLAGYMDIFILLLAVAAGYLAIRERYVGAGLLASPGPLIHDGFVFLWIPVVLLVGHSMWGASGRRRLQALSAVGIPFMAMAIVMAFHTDEKAFRVIDELSPDMRAAKDAFFSTKEAFTRMLDGYLQSPGQLPLALPVFVLPSLLCALCAQYLSPRRGWRNLLFLVLVTVAPCGVLLVAWDLSRFLVWSALGAFFTLAWSMKAQTRDAGSEPEVVSRRLRNFCAALASVGSLLAVGGPYMYAYFGLAFADYPIGPRWLSTTPGAYASYAWLRLFNRAVYTSHFPAGEGCQIRGTPGDRACTFIIDGGRTAVSDPVWLDAGDYVAEVDSAPMPGCDGARGHVTFHFDWRLAPTQRESFESNGRTALVSLHLSHAEAAMGRLRVVLSADTGCYYLTSLRVVSLQEASATLNTQVVTSDL